jgi:hypothetical protein
MVTFTGLEGCGQKKIDDAQPFCKIFCPVVPYKEVTLNHRGFVPQGTFSNVWRQFGVSTLEEALAGARNPAQQLAMHRTAPQQRIVWP